MSKRVKIRPAGLALWVFLVSFTLSGCGSGETQGVDGAMGTPPVAPFSPSEEAQTTQAAVLALTNQYRAQNGVGALVYNAQLTQAAQAFAELMGTLGFFDHNSPDGTTPGQRISAAGYDWNTWGENIAYYYATPQAVMTAWMNSSGHRANILNGNFKELGVGYYVGKSPTGNGTAAYWVQDFGAR